VLHAGDDFAAAHAALRDLDVALREVRRPATAEKREEIRGLWEIAMAHYRQNEVDRVESGWAADDLTPPRPWWQIEAELLAGPEPIATPQLVDEPDGRAERWAFPPASFWHVLDQRVTRGKLATVNGLSEQTRRARELTFVGRTRVKVLVGWVDEHPELARRASKLHETPAGFRATAQGILLPRPPKPAARLALR
jgi:hypothetical protein